MVKTMTKIAEIYCDAGYDNFTKKVTGYGSFSVYYRGQEVKLKRVSLPSATTNNEAEYMILLEVLAYIDRMERKGKEFDWNIFMDSMLVVRQSKGEWRVKANNLKNLNKSAREFLTSHPNVSLEWVGREKIVDILGH